MEENNAQIFGIIFLEDENEYSLWTEFGLTEEEKEIISRIMENHVNEGGSIRGDMKMIIKELRRKTNGSKIK